jgi:Predicted acyltransferases
MQAKVYFKNLNGFRFFAASLVIITHIELFKRRIGLDNIWANPFVFESGSAGVDFFFVLSGFLISYLLLTEKAKIGNINIKKFYIRRILRIWPLYYAVVLFCFLAIPYINLLFFKSYSTGIFENFELKFLFCLFMMPNVALSVIGGIPYAAPIWSIGVEEQFYLMWPYIMRKHKNLFRTIVIFIVSFIAIKVLLVVIHKVSPLDPDVFVRIKDFLVATRMECMGIGAAGAYLYYYKFKSSRFLSSNQMSAICLVLIPLVLYFAGRLFELHHIVLAVLFLIVIMNAATNEYTFIKLENKVFYYLGNISYGIYLLHPICIGVVLKLLLIYKLNDRNFALFNIALYLLTFALTIGLASASYIFFEKRFLNYKLKFANVVSGDDARSKTA